MISPPLHLIWGLFFDWIMSNNLLYLLLLLAFASMCRNVNPYTITYCTVEIVVFLFLFYFSIGVKGQNMESISSESVVKPGETLSLSCRGSGFTFGSYHMHWVRQQPGKALIWMGRVYTNGQGHDYSKSFEGRIEMTRDNSKSMVYLKLSGLTEEDSAVYFCARDAQCHEPVCK